MISAIAAKARRPPRGEPPAIQAVDPVPRAGIAAAEFSRTFWATRERDNPVYVNGYWAQRTHPLRARIAETIAELQPASVLEVGCHCGVNLWAIAQRSACCLKGVDVSEHVIAAGRELLASTVMPPPDLLVAGGDCLPFPDLSSAIVFSSGTLLCIGDAHIGQTMREMARVAQSHIVLFEPYPDAEKIDPYPNTTYWIRDYRPLLAECGFETVRCERLADAECMGHINSVLVARRSL